MSKAIPPGSISVELNPVVAWCQGRNGLVAIKGVSIWGDGDIVIFDCINRRGVVVNGGLGIEATAMDELATKWLEARGKR
jgi:hypothetical protein